MSWEAITSISTVFLTLFTLGLMIATFGLAYIALQANNTWKAELKGKKKVDLLRKAFTLLEDLNIHLYKIEIETNKAVHNFERVDEQLSNLNNILNEILNVQKELNFIKCEVFSNILVSIIHKGNNSPFYKKLTTNPNLVISDNIQKRQDQEVKALLANIKEIRELINQSIIICDNEIQKFYNK